MSDYDNWDDEEYDDEPWEDEEASIEEQMAEAFDDGEVNFKSWEEVQVYCDIIGVYEKDCIDANFNFLDKDNVLEWSLAFSIWFKNQPVLALFGWFFAPLSFAIGWIMFVIPNLIPNINNPTWGQLFDNPREAFYFQVVDYTASLILPDLWFWNQILSWGQSDLRDLSVIYMQP